ncbi:hypothetical protein AMTRI_Chr08g207200 [Amborella trichopoda]
MQFDSRDFSSITIKLGAPVRCKCNSTIGLQHYVKVSSITKSGPIVDMSLDSRVPALYKAQFDSRYYWILRHRHFVKRSLTILNFSLVVVGLALMRFGNVMVCNNVLWGLNKPQMAKMIFVY